MQCMYTSLYLSFLLLKFLVFAVPLAVCVIGFVEHSLSQKLAVVQLYSVRKTLDTHVLPHRSIISYVIVIDAVGLEYLGIAYM